MTPLDLACSQNHANYLGGRSCWAYEVRIELDTRLRILKRQRQQLQEAFGQVNRRLRSLDFDHRTQRRTSPPSPDISRARLFVEAAEQLLEPTTIRLLWELVDERHEATTEGNERTHPITPESNGY